MLNNKTSMVYYLSTFSYHFLLQNVVNVSIFLFETNHAVFKTIKMGAVEINVGWELLWNFIYFL